MTHTPKSVSAIKKQYEHVCMAYIDIFCEKQELEFDGWLLDEVGGIACFSERYMFDFNNVVLDINTEQKAGLILEWFEVTGNINYRSYTMGAR